MYFLLLGSVPIGMGRRTVGTTPTENGGCGRSSLFRSNAAPAAGPTCTAHGPGETVGASACENDRRVHLREAHASSDATDRRQHEERRA